MLCQFQMWQAEPVYALGHKCPNANAYGVSFHSDFTIAIFESNCCEWWWIAILWNEGLYIYTTAGVEPWRWGRRYLGATEMIPTVQHIIPWHSVPHNKYPLWTGIINRMHKYVTTSMEVWLSPFQSCSGTLSATRKCTAAGAIIWIKSTTVLFKIGSVTGWACLCLRIQVS